MRLNDIPPAPAIDGTEALLGLKGGSATLLPTAKIAAAAQRRLLLVGNRAQMLDTVAGGGGANNSGANYTRGESFYVVKNGPVGIRNLRLVFGNWALGPYENATAAPNVITVEAAIAIAATSSVGQVARVTFSGRTTVTLDPDGEVESDAVGIYIPPFASFSVRTGVTVPSGQTWPTGYLNSVSSGASAYDNAVASTSATSQIMTGAASLSTPSGGVSGQAGYGPVAILGEADGSMLAIAILGDSLTIGNTGAALGDGQGNRGVLGYGLASVNGGQATYNRLARASEAAYDFQFLDRSKHRMRLANYASHVIVWLGTNDVPTYTAAQIQGYLSGVYAQLRGRAQRIVAVTLPPRTTSTDAFATTTGQTPMAGYAVGGVRDQVNAWIKAQVGGLIDEVIDLNTVFESAIAPGVWAPTLTTDGTHPNEAGMQAGKGRVSSAAARWTAA